MVEDIALVLLVLPDYHDCLPLTLFKRKLQALFNFADNLNIFNDFNVVFDVNRVNDRLEVSSQAIKSLLFHVKAE
jgi:hypothetical protein